MTTSAWWIEFYICHFKFFWHVSVLGFWGGSNLRRQARIQKADSFSFFFFQFLEINYVARLAVFGISSCRVHRFLPQLHIKRGCGQHIVQQLSMHSKTFCIYSQVQMCTCVSDTLYAVSCSSQVHKETCLCRRTTELLWLRATFQCHIQSMFYVQRRREAALHAPCQLLQACLSAQKETSVLWMKTELTGHNETFWNCTFRGAGRDILCAVSAVWGILSAWKERQPFENGAESLSVESLPCCYDRH